MAWPSLLMPSLHSFSAEWSLSSCQLSPYQAFLVACYHVSWTDLGKDINKAVTAVGSSLSALGAEAVDEGWGHLAECLSSMHETLDSRTLSRKRKYWLKHGTRGG